MARCPAEQAEVMAALPVWLEARPDAGFIVGVVECGTSEEGYTVQIGHCDCDPVALVALASELLATASEKLCALARPEVADLICAIESARANLDFEVPERVS